MLIRSLIWCIDSNLHVRIYHIVDCAEIFEFDATCDPPSRLEVAVYDFDGPFDEATPIGQSEVNFVKSKLSDLSDIWIPLQGMSSQASQPKLHLRIFLDNTRGNELVMEYLRKMGKEVGKKVRNCTVPYIGLVWS